MSGTNSIGGTKTMLAGSPGCQAPEQLVWGTLGAVLLVLFGEGQVWTFLSPFQIMYKVTIEEKMPDIAHLPPSVQEVCKMCFSEVSLRPPANRVLQYILHNLIL